MSSDLIRAVMDIFTRNRKAAGTPAEPGSWFGRYHADWDRDHPGMWMRGEAQSGSFYAGDVWGSSTLDWDRAWFAAHGMSMPRRCVYRLDPVKGFRIGTLQPGETATIAVEIVESETDRG